MSEDENDQTDFPFQQPCIVRHNDYCWISFTGITTGESILMNRILVDKPSHKYGIDLKDDLAYDLSRLIVENQTYCVLQKSDQSVEYGHQIIAFGDVYFSLKNLSLEELTVLHKQPEKVIGKVMCCLCYDKYLDPSAYFPNDDSEIGIRINALRRFIQQMETGLVFVNDIPDELYGGIEEISIYSFYSDIPQRELAIVIKIGITSESDYMTTIEIRREISGVSMEVVNIIKRNIECWINDFLHRPFNNHLFYEIYTKVDHIIALIVNDRSLTCFSIEPTIISKTLYQKIKNKLRGTLNWFIGKFSWFR